MSGGGGDGGGGDGADYGEDTAFGNPGSFDDVDSYGTASPTPSPGTFDDDVDAYGTKTADPNPGPSLGPGISVNDPSVQALGQSFYSYNPDTSLEDAIGFTNAGEAAAAVADMPGVTLEQLDPYTFQAIKNGMPYGTPVNVDPDHPAAKAIAAVMGFIDPTPFGIFSKTIGAIDHFSPPSVFSQIQGHIGMQDAMGAADQMGGSPDPVTEQRFIQPVATPTAIVENVAAPVVAASATPISLESEMLMRPSLLNAAPANAPADYSLLYPAQERRFQESYALRPGYYSGPLDTTGYRPVASVLI